MSEQDPNHPPLDWQALDEVFAKLRPVAEADAALKDYLEQLRRRRARRLADREAVRFAVNYWLEAAIDGEPFALEGLERLLQSLELDDALDELEWRREASAAEAE